MMKQILRTLTPILVLILLMSLMPASTIAIERPMQTHKNQITLKNALDKNIVRLLVKHYASSISITQLENNKHIRQDVDNNSPSNTYFTLS